MFKTIKVRHFTDYNADTKADTGWPTSGNGAHSYSTSYIVFKIHECHVTIFAKSTANDAYRKAGPSFASAGRGPWH